MALRRRVFGLRDLLARQVLQQRVEGGRLGLLFFEVLQQLVESDRVRLLRLRAGCVLHGLMLRLGFGRPWWRRRRRLSLDRLGRRRRRRGRRLDLGLGLRRGRQRRRSGGRRRFGGGRRLWLGLGFRRRRGDRRLGLGLRPRLIGDGLGWPVLLRALHHLFRDRHLLWRLSGVTTSTVLTLPTRQSANPDVP